MEINVITPAPCYAKVLVTDSAEHVEELAKSDYITLDWLAKNKVSMYEDSESVTPPITPLIGGDVLPAGTRIVFSEVIAGQTRTWSYYLADPYTPSQVDEVTWRYTPKFEHPFFLLRRVPYFFVNKDGNTFETLKQPSWSLTSDIAGHFSVLVEAINNAIADVGGIQVQAEYDSSITLPSTVALEFNNVDILSAGQMIADAFGTEFWYSRYENKVYLSRASVGAGVELYVDYITPQGALVEGNVKVAQASRTGEGYYNIFYPLGSSRNMVQQAYTADVTKSLYTNRLTLDPDSFEDGCIDLRQSGEPAFSKVLIFDDIYPRSTFSIGKGTLQDVNTGVIARIRKRIDINTGEFIQTGYTTEGGEEVPTYEEEAIYYIHIPGFGFTPSTYGPDNPDGMMLPGLNVSIHFKDGSLAGREFEMRYVPVEEPEPPENGSGDTSGDISGDISGDSGSNNDIPIINEDGWVLIGNDKSDIAPFYLPVGDWWEICAKNEGTYKIPDMFTLVPQDNNQVIIFNIKMPDYYVGRAQEELRVAALAEIRRNYMNPSSRVEVNHNTYTVESNQVAFYQNNPGVHIGDTVQYDDGRRTISTRATALVTKLAMPWNQKISMSSEVQKGTIASLQDDISENYRDAEILARISKVNSLITESYDRINQLLLNRTKDFESYWVIDKSQLIGGKPSLRLDDQFAGVWAKGFISAGGIGSNSGGGGGGGGSTVTWQNSLHPNYAILRVSNDDTTVEKDVALYNHDHDDDYYTKSAVDTLLAGKASTGDITTAISDFSATLGDVAFLNKVTSIDANSTDAQIPTAKAVWSLVSTFANVWIIDNEHTVGGKATIKLNPLYAGAWTTGFLTASGIGASSGGGGGSSASWRPSLHTGYATLRIDDGTTVQDKDVALWEHGHTGETWLNTILAGYVPTSRSITTSTGLQGGGALSSDLILSVSTDYQTKISHGESAYTLLNALFEARYDDAQNPNTLTSIKAKAGLWSEQFITAGGLGTSGGGGGTAVQWTQQPLTGISTMKIATIRIDGNDTDVYAPSGEVTSVINLKGAISQSQLQTALGLGSAAYATKGAAGGVAELDSNGLVPTSQLPSYVDDVLEYASLSNFPATGTSGKIYVALDTNLTYRWGGTGYVEISPSLALGTTSSTAFRGDYGNTAYSHATENKSGAQNSGFYKFSVTAQGHIGGVAAVSGSDLTSLIGSTTYAPYNSDGYVPTTRKVNGHALSADVTVSASDVGLSNVENTALSTWAGTSSITTLGTITTGTWNGTAIANAYLANSAITINGTSTSLGGSFNTASITAGTAGTSTDTSGATLAVPYVTLNQYGIATGYGTHTHTISNLANSALQNSSITIGSTAVSLGGTITNLTGIGSISAAGALTLTTTKKIYFGDTSHYIELENIAASGQTANWVFHFSHGLYSDSFVSASGIGSGGSGGGGLIQTVYKSTNFGGTFSDTSTTDTFNAYSINLLYTSKQNVIDANNKLPYAYLSGAPSSLPANGGNADTVDNEHASAFAHIASGNNLIHYNDEFTFIPSGFSSTSLWINYRTVGSPATVDYTYRFMNGKANGGYAPIRAAGFQKDGSNGNYVLLGDGEHALISGLSVSSANTLTTTRTIWGQNFNGSANVSGAMSSVDSIDSLLYFDTTNSRVGVGTTSPSYKLHVNGSLNATTIYENGNRVLTSHQSLTDYVQGANVSGTSGLLATWTSNTGALVIGPASGYTIPLSSSAQEWDDAYDWVDDYGYTDYARTSQANTFTTGQTIQGDLRLKTASSNYGTSLYFGDGSYCYLYEDTDDHLKIYGSKGIQLATGSSYGISLDNTTTARTIRPYTSGGYDLGNSSYYWNSVWAQVYRVRGESVIQAGSNSTDGVLIGYGTCPTRGMQLYANGGFSFCVYDSSLSDPTWNPILQVNDNGFLLRGSRSLIFNDSNGNWHNAFRFGWNQTALVIGEGFKNSGYNTVVYGNTIAFYTNNGSSDVQVGDINASRAHFAVGVYSDSYITASGVNSSSDERLKTNLRPVDLTLAQIAAAPAVEFEWKKDGNKGAGSIAQYWQGILPHNVRKGADDMLSLEYGNIALLSAITVAREVETHEQKIKRLEARVAELERQLNA